MFRRNRWNHFVRIRYASWRRHSSKFRNNSNRQPRMPTIPLPRASTPPSTASWTRAVTLCSRHLALSVSGSCRTGISRVGHETHPCGVWTMAVKPCGGSPAQGRSSGSRYQYDLYAQVRAFSHAWHRHGGRYGRGIQLRQAQSLSETEKRRNRPTERQNDTG